MISLVITIPDAIMKIMMSLCKRQTVYMHRPNSGRNPEERRTELNLHPHSVLLIKTKLTVLLQVFKGFLKVFFSPLKC